MLYVSDDGSALALRWIDQARQAQIELASPRIRSLDPAVADRAPNDMVDYTVTISGNGLSARALVLSLDSAGDGLPRFFEELAGAFRGWDGTRAWENAAHNFGVEATWTTRGHVALRWWLTPSIYDRWTASVVLDVEAGAQMSALADALATFFAVGA